uniref:Uncharacterized protein n=1 Tax=Anopheles arabiensis TaxID=7173 RepID=A0A182HP78_ANOAR
MQESGAAWMGGSGSRATIAHNSPSAPFKRQNKAQYRPPTPPTVIPNENENGNDPHVKRVNSVNAHPVEWKGRRGGRYGSLCFVGVPATYESSAAQVTPATVAHSDDAVDGQ